ENAVVVPLVLQPEQDAPILGEFVRLWTEGGGKIEQLDAAAIVRPSQWLSFLGGFDLVIAMRLHCAILALKKGVPTVAIAYDPKVAQIANQFELPTLNLTNNANDGWATTIEQAVAKRAALKEVLLEKVAQANELACQNFASLAKILEMQ